MRHIFGRLYYFKPFFIGIRCDSWKRAWVYNAIGTLITIGIILLVILKIAGRL